MDEEKKILVRGIFGDLRVRTPEQLKEMYKNFKYYSQNVPSDEKPKFFYEHRIVCYLDYNEFLEIIKEV